MKIYGAVAALAAVAIAIPGCVSKDGKADATSPPADVETSTDEFGLARIRILSDEGGSGWLATITNGEQVWTAMRLREADAGRFALDSGGLPVLRDENANDTWVAEYSVASSMVAIEINPLDFTRDSISQMVAVFIYRGDRAVAAAVAVGSDDIQLAG